MTGDRAGASREPATTAGVLVGVILDNAREAVMQGLRIGVEPDVVVVSPAGYAALASVKHAEIRHGANLTLLGKSVRSDAGLTGEQVTTALSGHADEEGSMGQAASRVWPADSGRK